MKKQRVIFLAGVLLFNLNSGFASDYIIKKSRGSPPEIIENGLIKNLEKIILIDKSEHLLVFHKKGEGLKKYQVATGKDPKNKTRIGQWSTPEGIFKINKKRKVDNPDFGTRVIGLNTDYLGFKGIYIHGTYKEKSIGKDISKGCVRMRNKDVEELYNLISIGDTIIIKP